MSEYVFRTEEPIEYCYDCPINNQENGRCRLGVETSGCEIPKKCHLVEVSQHGRLGDLDALAEYIKNVYCKDCKRSKVMCKACEYGDMIDEIENALTVIEAST